MLDLGGGDFVVCIYSKDGAINFIKNVKNKRIDKLSIRKNEDGSIEQIETEEIVSGGVYYYDQIKYYDK